MREACILAMLVMLVSCADPAADRPVAEVGEPAPALPDSLVLDLRIGESAGAAPTTFSTVADIAVDTQGRMHVLLPQEHVIRVFAADGSHLRTLSRVGFGPGELGTPLALWFSPEGQLWVYDANPGEFEIFDSSGTWVGRRERRTRGLPCSTGAHSSSGTARFTVTGALMDCERRMGGMVGGSMPLMGHLHLLSDSLLPDVTFPLNWKATPAEHWAYREEPVWALDPAEAVWYARSRTYEIFKLSFAGDTMVVARRDISPPAIERQDLVTACANHDAALRSTPMAGARCRSSGGRAAQSDYQTKPYFTQFVVDDQSRLWVAVSGARDGLVEAFDLFETDGTFLRRIPVHGALRMRSPANDQSPSGVLRIRDGHLYGVQELEDGSEAVVRFRIVQGGGGRS